MSSLSAHGLRAGSNALQCARRPRLAGQQQAWPAQQLGPSTPACCLCSGHRRMQQALRGRCLASPDDEHRSKQLVVSAVLRVRRGLRAWQLEHGSTKCSVVLLQTGKAAPEACTSPAVQRAWFTPHGDAGLSPVLEASLQQTPGQSQHPDMWLQLARQALAVLCATALVASSCFLSPPAHALSASHRPQVAMVVMQAR